jgi:hypothetical protein
MRRLFVWLGLLAAAASCAACSNDFAPYSRLDRLRILAIASDPATPAPGQPATLTALTYAPGGMPIALRWSWCPVSAPASSAYACPIDEATATHVFGPLLDPSAAMGLPGFDLGAATDASFTNPFSPTALAGLCASGLATQTYASDFDCQGGYPVTIALDASAGTESLRAGFVLRLPTGALDEVNQNPSPTGIALADTALPNAPTSIVVAPGKSLPLRADIPTEAAEPRAIPSFEGAPGVRLERLTTSWFATAGTLDKDRTSFIDGDTTLTEMGQNRWTAPAADAWPPDGALQIAVVVRDDRGGMGWLVRTVTLVQGP